MRKNSKTSEVFNELCKNVDIFFTGLSNPKAMLVYGYDDFINMQNVIRRAEIKRAIKRMEKQKIVKLIKRGDKVNIYLTESGKIEKIKRAVFLNKVKMPKGYVCLVSFDIPERIRGVRNILRNLFCELGFISVHRSVWESKIDVRDELRLLAKKLKISDWLKVYSAKRIV